MELLSDHFLGGASWYNDKRKKGETQILNKKLIIKYLWSNFFYWNQYI